MKFTQSRYQDFFSRCLPAALGMLVTLFIWAVLAFFDIDQSLLQSYEIKIIAFLALSLVYLWFKYPQGSKTLEITEQQLTFTDRETITEIKVTDFLGFRLSRFFPHDIVLEDKIYGETRFSYYAFSAQQRQQIFPLLEKFGEASGN